jgi:hypothetical protein
VIEVPVIHYVVQANGLEDDSEVYFTCATLEIATERAKQQLEDDCLENDEYNDAPPEIEDGDNNTRIVSYDDYMSYKISPVQFYAH